MHKFLLIFVIAQESTFFVGMNWTDPLGSETKTKFGEACNIFNKRVIYPNERIDLIII